ncbi:MAG: hypothetical protein J6A28_04800 [Clostridia bacterium]|nr:hypothetical protein [Clostridia bacterium]
MAEKKKGGKGKKIAIIMLALLVVAVTVVLLVVFLPKNKSTADNFKEITSITIADNEESKADYVLFEEKIAKTSGVQYYSDELSAIKSLTNSLDSVADFYNDYYLFAQDNSFNGQINDGINQIKNSQKKLNDILAAAKLDVEAGMSIIQSTWIDYRATAATFVKGYQKLFEGMNKAYHSSLGNVLVTNDASRVILNTVDAYVAVIISDIDKLVSSNLSGSKESTYSLGDLGAKIEGFSHFVASYIKDQTHIQNFYYTMPECYGQLAKFEQTFGENLTKLLDTISYNPELEISYSNNLTLTNAQAAALLSNMKAFVLGGEV